jgi:hypothetical protein
LHTQFWFRPKFEVWSQTLIEVSPKRKFLNRSFANRWSLIVEQTNKLRNRQRGKVQFGSSKICKVTGRLFRARSSNSINRSGDVWLGDLRRRAADAEPTAGVDQEQTSVGGFEDVSRVKVRIVAAEEFCLGRSERSAGSFYF